MKLMWFDLPDDEGQVTVMTRPRHSPEPLTMVQAMGRPIRAFVLWHACGGLMEFVTVSPRKTVLFCACCGSRTKTGPFERLFHLMHWVAVKQNTRLHDSQLALPLTHAEWNHCCNEAWRKRTASTS